MNRVATVRWPPDVDTPHKTRHPRRDGTINADTTAQTPDEGNAARFAL
jgi:hypothetical protein